MIFEVTPAHIEALSDADLRTLIGYLAECEVVHAGHSPAAVTYGGHQNAADGGIDVRVSLTAGATTGYIPSQACGYQVKAESFAKADIIKEMKPRGTLRPSIVELGKARGAYIIVSSKTSASDAGLTIRTAAMVEALADDPDAAPLVVDFFDQRRIATWVNQHPGLIPWVRSKVGLPLSGWRPFQDWSSSPGPMSESYLADGQVRLVGGRVKDSKGVAALDGVAMLRKILTASKGMVRLVGLSGVGKTRLVQALFDKAVGEHPLDQQLAIYTDLSENPDPVPLELLDALQTLGKRCIVIVDNCGIDLHRRMGARLRADSQISLITVEYDISDDEPENTDVFKLEPASADLIEKILERRHPNLTGPEVRTIAKFSEGNARVALALADTAKYGGSVANLNDRDLFDRLFWQRNQSNPALLRAAKACSLVYSFDAEASEGDEAELPLLAKLAEQTFSELHGHVAELQRRQLVQRRGKWRAVLPHALAHRLAKQALQDIPKGALRRDFTDAAPQRLLKSFSRRIGCLHDSAEAQALVAEWLSDDQSLARVEDLSPIGVQLLENVAPVNPDAVLTAIQAAADRDEDFVARSGGSRIVSLLRDLAYEPSSFDQAVNLLTRFAKSKTESNNSGDAVNVFKSLFHLHLSGTHAPAAQRASFLQKLARRGEESDVPLVMAGIDAMLECSRFMSSYGFDFGARRRDYGFQPKTYEEQNDWYTTVFATCVDLNGLPKFREPVRKIVSSQFRFLAAYTGLIDELVELADTFARDGGWPEGWAGVRSALRGATEAHATAAAEKLKALEARLKPDSLAHRLTSYVLPDQWGVLDIAELDLADEKRYAKAQQQVSQVCQSIGRELAADFDALREHLPPLLRTDSQRALTVATGIGREASDPRAAWEIILGAVLSAERKGNVYSFPAAFLIGLAERDRALVETILDEAMQSPPQHAFVVHMQTSVGIDTRGCARLVEASKVPTVPVFQFRNIGYSNSWANLSPADFKRLLLAVAEREDGFDTAIDILSGRFRFIGIDKLQPSDEEKEAGLELLSRADFRKKSRRDGRELAEIARQSLSLASAETAARTVASRLLDAILDYRASPYDYNDLMAELAVNFPEMFLDMYLEGGWLDIHDKRNLFRSFRAHRPSPLRKVSDETLLNWVRQKPKTRFKLLAEVVGPWKTDKPSNTELLMDDGAKPVDWTELAKGMMLEAPDPVAVVAAMCDQFWPSGWSGSLATILESRLPLLEALTEHSDQRIVSWATVYIPQFKDAISKTRASEAERDRARDERFEW